MVFRFLLSFKSISGNPHLAPQKGRWQFMGDPLDIRTESFL